jgi:hypothetical protein
MDEILKQYDLEMARFPNDITGSVLVLFRTKDGRHAFTHTIFASELLDCPEMEITAILINVITTYFDNLERENKNEQA